MKRLLVLMMAAALMSGCAAEPVYETIGNAMEDTQPVISPGKIELVLPEEAEMQVIEDEYGSKSYRIGDREVWTQICDGGDVSATLEKVTGIRADALTVMEHQVLDMPCHEIAWITTNEEGTFVARTAVLDDGNYHYCVSLMMPEADAEKLGDSFSELLSGVSISGTDA